MSEPARHRPPLGAHRLLGDGYGAALILPDGEIDWWCPDRFEAEPLLWTLLDATGATSRWCDAMAATWDSSPAGPTAHTAVRIGDARVELWDGLVADDGGSVLVRLVRTSGPPCVLHHHLELGGFEHEPRRTLVPGTQEIAGRSGAPEAGPVLSVPTGTDVVSTTGTRLTLTVGAPWTGFAVSTSGRCFGTGELVDLLEQAEARHAQVMRRIRLPMRHPSRATDALLVLQGLTDGRTGAPVAAATTSLPEAPGGDRQFDYRFSWLRDAALAVSTATLLGHVDAAGDYLDFVAELVEQHGEHLTPLTTSTGEPVPDEREVSGVAGWAASRPVRVGNAATEQRQLDSVAAVIDAVASHALRGGRLRPGHLRLVDRLATMLAEAGTEPTSGIWELRRPARLVSEELARWHGLDRALQLMRRRRPWRRRPAWRAARAAARARVEAAWDDDLGHLPQTLDGDPTPDAATLLAALAFFWPRDDERLARHVRRLVERLEEGAFLRRYPPADDGFTGVEAAFLPTSWWAVRALAIIGDLDAAHARADDMCLRLPPLLAEQWDPVEEAGLGNVPLLWSHAEAARALYSLDEEHRRRRYGAWFAHVWAAARSLRVRVTSRIRPSPLRRA